MHLMKFSNYFTTRYHEVEKLPSKDSSSDSHKIYHLLPKEAHHYSSSFGYQWNNYQKTQIDRFNTTTATRAHLELMLGKKVSTLRSKTVLEVGSGAGRYTDYLVQYAKEVVTVDPSTAIYSNVALGASNLLAVHGDLFNLPVKKDVFDLVYCRGVIQHTFNPQIAIWQLYTYYYIRPFTRRIERKNFHAFLTRSIPPLLWFKIHVLNRITPNIWYIKEIPNIILPIFDYSRLMPELIWDENVNWAIMNCLDAYTPEYDNPLS